MKVNNSQRQKHKKNINKVLRYHVERKVPKYG